MNIIVDRPQLVRVVLLYLNNNFGNLTTKTGDDTVSYVNSYNETLILLSMISRVSWFHGKKLWNKIESLFPLNYGEVQSILELWMRETYNVRYYTAERIWRDDILNYS